MTNQEAITTTATAANLQSFIHGVMDAHTENSLDTEYASLFWGNVTGDEFASLEDAYDNGKESVENTL